MEALATLGSHCAVSEIRILGGAATDSGVSQPLSTSFTYSDDRGHGYTEHQCRYH